MAGAIRVAAAFYAATKQAAVKHGIDTTPEANR
jgi:hypothetical protein